jgi:hypothetical protein
MSEQTPATEAAAWVREVLAAEREQLGKPATVRAPLEITINNLRVRVVPCSGKHRAYFLTGHVVLEVHARARRRTR